MHRNKVLKLLNKYIPESPEAINNKKKMLSFISQNSRCFDRTNHEGHVTASAFLLDSSRNMFLLTHHAKLDIWIQLGGHCDGESDVLNVAIREACEESGIRNIKSISNEIFDIDIHEIPKYKGEKEHLHYDIRFLLQACSNEKIQISSESKDLKWFNFFDELPEENESVLRMVNKARELLPSF